MPFLSQPPALSKYFVSAETTITSGGLATIAHGLGTEPKLIQLNLICKSAEDGYSVGDEILMSQAGSSSGAYNQSVTWDSTNIYVRFEDASTAFTYSNKSTGVSSTLTNSKWNLLVKAWK